MNKNFMHLCCFLLFITTLQAQMTNQGSPKSWTVKTPIQPTDYHLMPTFDLNKQKKVDALNEATGMKPWQFGYEHTVSLGLNNSGTWTNLPNGDRIWQIEFESKDALSMNLIFDEYFLPEDATVYLYNPKTKEHQGAYTSKNNSPDRMLGTTLLQGDNMVVEYYEPANQIGKGVLNISMVVHGYRALGGHPQAKSLNSSGKCNLDVACPLGIGWENQINSVAIIIVGGSGACTGALVNNTSNDGTPYFLSANHCGTTGLGAWVFRFNWDSPVAVCAANGNSQDPGSPYNEVNGATLRANNGGSDFCLMELNTAPTGNIYYAGWDRSSTPATQATGIHHPDGDVKKISRENDVLVANTMSGADVWQVVNWDQGVTEPGSSGSPLFNQNQLLIGQLYGGGSACSGLVTNGQDDNYGRFDISWNGTSVGTRLSDWLDSAGTGAITHLGYNPNGPGIALDAGVAQISGIQAKYCNIDSFIPEITVRNYGSTIITTVDIIYNIDGGTNTTYTWNGSLASSTTTTVTLPTQSSTQGAHIFYVSTTMPNGSLDSNAVNDVRSFSFYITMGGQIVNYTLATDCYGSETTWALSDSATGAILFTGGPYDDGFGAPDTLLTELCLPVGCYRFAIYDNYGDGIDGTSVWFCGRSGDYWIHDGLGNSLVEMAAAAGNFGDSAVHYFCITPLITNQTNLQTTHQFKVFPNPTNGNVYVDLKLQGQQNIVLELYNATGQLLQSIQQMNTLEERFQFDLQEYSAGLYFVKLSVGDKIYAQKVLKQ